MTTPAEDAKMRAEIAAEMDAEESGETPTVDESPAQSDDGDQSPADPWEGVSPVLKQAFDEMSNRVAAVSATEARLKQAESRIGAITNELHVAKKAVKDAPTAEQMAAAQESDEKWENLKNDFPDWAEAFDGRFDKKLSQSIERLRDELKGAASQAGMTAEAFEERLLTFAKPKWKTIIASPEWKEWIAAQPPERASLVSSPLAEDARDLIDAFEESTKTEKTATEIAAERKQRLNTAVLPKGGKSVPLKSEADMSPSELRANIGKEIYAE
jgi:hypothetical protein